MAQGKGIYNNGRHEQTVWSYLAVINNIKVRNSQPYSFTTAAGSGTLNPKQYESQMKPRLERRFLSMKQSMVEFILKHDNSTTQNTLVEQSKEALIKQYLNVSSSVYTLNKIFEGIGFPPPQEARFSLVLLHRGAMARQDQYKYSGRLLNYYKNIRDDVFILLGNGPSLADVNLASLAPHFTFGLNAAYRGYERVNFWPKFFGCFDALVCSNHSATFKKLIKDSPIQKFFFIDIDDNGKKIFTQDELSNNKRFEDIRFNYRSRERRKIRPPSISFKYFLDMRTSGANTIQSALLMGFRNLFCLESIKIMLKL